MWSIRRLRLSSSCFLWKFRVDSISSLQVTCFMLSCEDLVLDPVSVIRLTDRARDSGHPSRRTASGCYPLYIREDFLCF